MESAVYFDGIPTEVQSEFLKISWIIALSSKYQILTAEVKKHQKDANVSWLKKRIDLLAHIYFSWNQLLFTNGIRLKFSYNSRRIQQKFLNNPALIYQILTSESSQNIKILAWHLSLFYKIQLNEWDRSIFSKTEPTFDIALLQYFWKFTQICMKFAGYERKIDFVIV